MKKHLVTIRVEIDKCIVYGAYKTDVPDDEVHEVIEHLAKEMYEFASKPEQKQHTEQVLEYIQNAEKMGPDERREWFLEKILK